MCGSCCFFRFFVCFVSPRLAEPFALYLETLTDAVAHIRMPAHALALARSAQLLQPSSGVTQRQPSETQTSRQRMFAFVHYACIFFSALNCF